VSVAADTVTNSDQTRGMTMSEDRVDRLRHHVEVLAAGPRHRAIPGSLQRARDYCVRELGASGWEITQLPFRSGPSLLRTSDYGRAWWPVGAGGPIDGVNLIAHRGNPDGAIWLLAHLDSVHSSPGADDNASGVAALLELARHDLGPDVAIVLTDSEEAGVLGARYLAKETLRPRLVINLESVGYFQDAPGTQRLFPEITLTQRETVKRLRADGMRADFLLAVHRPNSAAAARAWEQHAAAAGLRTVLLEDRRWNGRGQSLTRLNPIGLNLDRSDHAPFWRAQVPAVMISDTALLRNRNYHRPSDTPDTLDYPRMAQLVASLTHTLPELREAVLDESTRLGNGAARP